MLRSNDMFSKFNSQKRNKNSIVRQTNNLTRQRNDDNIDINNQYDGRMNVDRIMLERQMTSHNFDSDDELYVGEVTGDKIDSSDIYDKGMPVRSSYTIKKSKYDNNDHHDFDLFKKFDKKQLKNVAYLDTSSSGDYAGLDEAMKPITSGSDPYEICINDVNSITCWLHSNMFVFSREDYVVNGFGLFLGFGALYMISTGNTEIELKNYFNYQDKRHLNAGLLTLRDDMNDFRDQLIIDAYLLNDMRIPNNIKVAKKLKSLVFSIVINRGFPDQEANRVNDIIRKISDMKDVISPSTISKSDISLITVCRFNPIWAHRIDNIVKTRFIVNNQSVMMDFIRFMGKTFDYYEDAEKQLIEIPLYGDKYMIGMLLSKSDDFKPFDLKNLSIAINYLKPTILDEVLIPMIAKRYKLRLNKTLQKTGLNVVFNEQEFSGLYSEGGSLNDCIQYIDIRFSNQCGKKISNNKGYRTTRKFVANRDFEFYLRNRENNCIMIAGRI